MDRALDDIIAEDRGGRSKGKGRKGRGKGKGKKAGWGGGNNGFSGIGTTSDDPHPWGGAGAGGAGNSGNFGFWLHDDRTGEDGPPVDDFDYSLKPRKGGKGKGKDSSDTWGDSYGPARSKGKGARSDPYGDGPSRKGKGKGRRTTEVVNKGPDGAGKWKHDLFATVSGSDFGMVR